MTKYLHPRSNIQNKQTNNTKQFLINSVNFISMWTGRECRLWIFCATAQSLVGVEGGGKGNDRSFATWSNAICAF